MSQQENVTPARRFFAAAVGKVDLAVLLRSPAAAVQLAALRASNTLSQHVETLPSASLPCVVKLLQSSDGMCICNHSVGASDAADHSC